MEYRSYRDTDCRPSLLGLGCMRLPTLEPGGTAIDYARAGALVDEAVRGGITYFDVAYPYHGGGAEKFIGAALEKYPRESFYLATKMPLWKLETQEDMEQVFNEQLANCRVDYFDFYLCHAVDAERFEKIRRIGAFEFLARKKAEGKIRRLGFSFHDKPAVLRAICAAYPWDFAQLQLNYLDWKHASGRNVNADYLYGELEKRGIPAVIMEPLLGGRLSNVPDHIVARLKQQRPENSVASWAFRFAGSPDGVLTVLSGMTYMEHLQDNIRTYSPLIPVTDEEKDFLEETAQLMMKYPTIPCNDCKYCMPCPYALDIPGILLHYNKCVNEGNVPKSVQDENYAKARRAFLVGYDRSVPKLRQANHCTGCEQCNPHCPQGIDIPKEMQRIDKFVEELKVNG